MKFRVSPYGSIINFGEGGYSKLIKFNVESGEEEDLYTFPEGVRSFFFNDGWLYWGSLSGIFRSDKDNTEEIQLPSEHTTDVTRSVLGVEGEWLFYTVSI